MNSLGQVSHNEIEPGVLKQTWQHVCNDEPELSWFYQLAVPAILGSQQGTADKKSISPLFPEAGEQWLQMTSAYNSSFAQSLCSAQSLMCEYTLHTVDQLSRAGSPMCEFTLHSVDQHLLFSCLGTRSAKVK